MNCTCEYGSSLLCEFCQHRQQVHERLQKLEDTEAGGYTRGVAAERARVVAWLRERAIEESSYAPNYIDDMADAIERGEHEENGNG